MPVSYSVPVSPTLIRLPQVKQCTGLSRSTIYSLIKKGDFPVSVALGARAIAFVKSEVDEWIQERIASRSNSLCYPVKADCTHTSIN